MLSQQNPVTASFMRSLSELVEKYNKYLEETNGFDQLNIHRQLQEIMDAIEKFLPVDHS